MIDDKKDVIINCKNVNIMNMKYDKNAFNFKITLMDENKTNKSFGPKLTTKPNLKTNLNEFNFSEFAKKDSSAKGLKKYSQGYTVNKLTKEAGSKVDSYVKVINKSKTKPKRPSSSKKRKVATHEKRYSGHFSSSNKPLLGNSIGLYNGNFGDRNGWFVNQNTLSLNLGSGTFNQDHSTRGTDNFISKTATTESFNERAAVIKSKSVVDKIGNMKKAGPIKATLASEKIKSIAYTSNEIKPNAIQMTKIKKNNSREKRPHSSTFIGGSFKESEMFNKILNTKPVQKQKPQSAKPKKTGKRVRSASPANLTNYLTQKQKQSSTISKTKVQRMIGGNLYQSNTNQLKAKNIKPTLK